MHNTADGVDQVLRELIWIATALRHSARNTKRPGLNVLTRLPHALLRHPCWPVARPFLSLTL